MVLCTVLSILMLLFELFPDPPEIAVENQIVFSGEGQEAALTCIVHGETQPEVSNNVINDVPGTFRLVM
jgi:hypothetical protein